MANLKSTRIIGDLIVTGKMTHPSYATYSITNANGLVLSGFTSDATGHVTGVTSKTLASADIPNLDASKIASGVMSVSRISQSQASAQTVVVNASGTFYATAPSVGQHKQVIFDNTGSSNNLTVSLRLPTSGTYFVYSNQGNAAYIHGILGASAVLYSGSDWDSTSTWVVWLQRIA